MYSIFFIRLHDVLNCLVCFLLLCVITDFTAAQPIAPLGTNKLDLKFCLVHYTNAKLATMFCPKHFIIIIIYYIVFFWLVHFKEYHNQNPREKN